MRRPRLRGVRLLGRGCDFWVGGATFGSGVRLTRHWGGATFGSVGIVLGGCDFWVGGATFGSGQWLGLGSWVRLLGRGWGLCWSESEVGGCVGEGFQWGIT